MLSIVSSICMAPKHLICAGDYRVTKLCRCEFLTYQQDACVHPALLPNDGSPVHYNIRSSVISPLPLFCFLVRGIYCRWLTNITSYSIA